MTIDLDFIAPLFVPEIDLNVSKARHPGDAIIIDLEDAVPAEAKISRQRCNRFYQAAGSVCINGCDTACMLTMWRPSPSYLSRRLFFKGRLNRRLEEVLRPAPERSDRGSDRNSHRNIGKREIALCHALHDWPSGLSITIWGVPASRCLACARSSLCSHHVLQASCRQSMA